MKLDGAAKITTQEIAATARHAAARARSTGQISRHAQINAQTVLRRNENDRRKNGKAQQSLRAGKEVRDHRTKPVHEGILHRLDKSVNDLATRRMKTGTIELRSMESVMPRALPVLLFALVFPSVMTWLYFGRETPAAKAIYALAKVIQFSLPVLWWLVADRSRLRWPELSWPAIWPGFAFGLVVAFTIIGLYFGWLKQHPMMESLAERARAKTGSFGLTSPALFLSFALFLSIIHALLEEYYWRAFVFVELRALGPLSVAVAVSALGFMAHHV